MEKFNVHCKDAIKEALALNKAPRHITGENVYQIADERVLKVIDEKITKDLLLPESYLTGIEHLNALYEKACGGASCLLMCEHYSNMDLPIISYLIRQAGGENIAASLLAIAGMKLNEDDAAMAVFSSAFTRIIICPSKQAQSIDPEKDKEEKLRILNINRCAMKKLDEVKKEGKIVLLFPSATRYRPWDPSSRNVQREIDSYVKGFDYLCFASLNGEIMHIHQGEMIEDTVSNDLIIITVSPMQVCAEFRQKIREKCEKNGIEDKKQAVADEITKTLLTMHEEAELIRQKKLG
ncbi:MAG: 1-acyl-sn-glycerol-3-phosphate acyltransferase [Termitinemataceae bacterium]|nr:MAG: 1-acyl-sn-glycerol-3-phosphate acyltransferase [Termitinemataceae bacterium]